MNYEEIWKDIREFEGYYQISNYGRVKSLRRIITDCVNHTYVIPERILKSTLDKNGYENITLCKNGIPYKKYIHQLVIYHFSVLIPCIKNEYIPNHKDGKKANNYFTNLEWTTYAENNQHAYDNNLKPRGENFYNSKLTEENVREIKINGKDSTYDNIGNKYNVSGATVRDVLEGNTWKHVHI